MSDAIDAKPFPRGALLAGGILIGVSLMFALVARTTDIGATRLDVAPVVKALDVNFTDLANGSVAVVSVAEKRVLAELAPGQSGFVRVVMRGLARDRMVRGIGPTEPFRIARHSDGQSTVTDLATGEVVTLTAFGSNNAAAFEQFLD